MLQHQNAHRGDPHDDDRAKIADSRQLQAKNLLASDSQLVAMVEQVGREEERKEQLGEFTRLQGAETGDADPDARAVDILAEHGKHGGKQQHQADHHADIGEPAQNTVVTHGHDQYRTQHDCQTDEHQLPCGDIGVVLMIDTGDHHRAEPGQQQYARLDHLTRIRQEMQHQPPEHQRQCDDQAKQHREIRGYGAAGAGEQLEKGHAADKKREQQQ